MRLHWKRGELNSIITMLIIVTIFPSPINREANCNIYLNLNNKKFKVL